MPTLFFADLVRELCQEGGTGPLTPTGAVPGHRRFAGNVPIDTPFHYAIAGVVHEGQWETGLGRIDTSGRLVRDTVAASSNGGALVDFAPGLKTIALTVGAGWFAASAAATDAQATALATKQPLSTTHDMVTTGAAGDLATVRRGGGWVNIPLSALTYRDAAGAYPLGGALLAANGGAAAPAISFASDPDCGIFRPAADAMSFATAGAERMRVDASGNLAVGTGTGLARLHVAGSGSNAVLIRATGAKNLWSYHDTSSAGWGTGTGGAGLVNYTAQILLNDTASQIRLYTAASERLRITDSGPVQPGADNSQSLGAPSARWSVVYAGTGTINTSDERDKAWRGAPTGAELAAARRIADALGFYQWHDAIAVRGPDGARYHFGVRAQQVWAIMAEEGLVDPLDASGRPGTTRYAFLCWDEWDAEGAGAARTRFGIRPDQLALFLIAAQEARIAALEAAA